MFKRPLMVAILCGSISFTTAARAAIIQIDGTGTVSFLNAALNGNGFFALGDGISFTITYDDGVADTNADPAIGAYDGILAYSLTFGTYSITSTGEGIFLNDNTVPSGVSDRVFFNDTVANHSANSGQVSGFDISTSRVLIQDADSVGLLTDVLLGLVLDPTVFNNSIAQMFFTGVTGVGVGGSIDAFRVTDVTPPQVPLPAAAPLMLLGLAGLRLAGKNKRRRQKDIKTA